MKRLRVRFTVRRLMGLVAAIAGVLAIIPDMGKSIIDELRAPVAVEGWSDPRLLLADGRTVSLPGLPVLPGPSPVFLEAIKRGVEVRKDGRVYALIRIHHWCGNEGIREHVAKVDQSAPRSGNPDR